MSATLGHGNGMASVVRYNQRALEQIVGRERRERVSQLTWCGEGCFDSRRRVNSTVRRPRRQVNVDVLSKDDQLVLRVALATCFAYPRDLDGVPFDDVRLYVDHLIDLHSRHPGAATNSSAGLPQDMTSALEFCAAQLNDVAPNEATRLRLALGRES